MERAQNLLQSQRFEDTGLKEPEVDEKGKRINLAYEPPASANVGLMRALRAVGCKGLYVMNVGSTAGDGLMLKPSGYAFRLDRGIKLDAGSGKTSLGPHATHRERQRLRLARRATKKTVGAGLVCFFVFFIG